MAGHNVDQETQEMLRSFVSEALDSLDTNEPLVEELRNEDNAEFVNAIFRVFHTLKGLSGFFDMKVIHKVTHEAETLLDLMRKNNQVQDEDSLSLIYSCFDFLRALLEKVSEDYSDESGRDEAEDIILIIKAEIEKVKGGGSKEQEELSEDAFFNFDDAESEVKPEPDQPDPEDAFISQTEEIQEEDQDFENIVGDDMLSQYINDAFDLLETCENNLMKLENEPGNLELAGETFGAIHSLKGNSGFMGLAEIEEVSSEIETILDSVRSGDLEIDETIITILLSNVESIKGKLKALAAGSPEFESEEAEEVKEQEEEISEEDFFAMAEEPVKDEQAQPETNEHTEDDFEEEIIHEEVKEEPKVKVQKAPVEEKKAVPVAKSKPEQKKTAQPTTPRLTMQKKDIRVETSKIDKLFDLVGELITIESMVTNNPDLKGLDLPNFAKSANMLNKITRELQEVTMSVRMMPLEGLFNKMKRLVRDVSIKMNKKVEFEISGQETEMDKNVIDEIADPLVHILRNAIDHGVETPADREAAGKNEVGHVSLKAKYEGNEILIIIEDDGAGINRERVLQKAEEKGLLSAPPETLSDRDVYMLVFEPGFSTAKQVTDISGRGVGMDVVKKNIEKLRGSIDVESNFGQGSKFTLRIPLTLAILDAMLIRIGKSIFALPILSVSESFRTELSSISETMDGLEMVRIREDIIPVVRLHELYKKDPDSNNIDSGVLIIAESRDRKLALFADEIVGQQQAVIKGFSGYIGKVPGITGCMILGDGGIGLIIDMEGLFDMAENRIEFANVEQYL